VPAVWSARAVSEADPDGYTLLLSRVGMALSPAVDPDNSVPWDAYSFIEILEVTPMILAVRADAPYESVADLMAAIEAADGGMTYAASGATAIDGFTVQALLDDHGLDPLTAATLVPYDGGGALATALLGGSVDFVAIASASLMPHIEAGTVKALGVYSPVRMAALPDVPTMEELGHTGAGQVIGWSGFYGPPGLSDAVLATLREAVLDVGADDRWVELAEARGSTSTIGLYDDVPAFVEGQYEFFRGLAERFGYLN
jgi:tripartite-type tricarboxylate transporter receptor subunit TctC